MPLRDTKRHVYSIAVTQFASLPKIIMVHAAVRPQGGRAGEPCRLMSKICIRVSAAWPQKQLGGVPVPYARTPEERMDDERAPKRASPSPVAHGTLAASHATRNA